MLQKGALVEYEPLVIEWTEGTEENNEWKDAWQADEPAEETAQQQRTRTQRANRRADRIGRAAERRIVPDSDAAVPAVQMVGATRIGREVRRPSILDL